MRGGSTPEANGQIDQPEWREVSVTDPMEGLTTASPTQSPPVRSKKEKGETKGKETDTRNMDPRIERMIRKKLGAIEREQIIVPTTQLSDPLFLSLCQRLLRARYLPPQRYQAQPQQPEAVKK